MPNLRAFQVAVTQLWIGAATFLSKKQCPKRGITSNGLWRLQGDARRQPDLGYVGWIDNLRDAIAGPEVIGIRHMEPTAELRRRHGARKIQNEYDAAEWMQRGRQADPNPVIFHRNGKLHPFGVCAKANLHFSPSHFFVKDPPWRFGAKARGRTAVVESLSPRSRRQQ